VEESPPLPGFEVVMKVSVVGAGAIGSMLGGLLKHHSPDIDLLLIGRGPHGEAMRQRGHVFLRGWWGEHRVPVRFSDLLADIAGSDFVLFTVKSHATVATIRQAAAYLGDAILISIQNGINGRLLAPHVTPGRLVIGLNAGNMVVVEPGVVSLQLSGVTMVGPPVPGRLRPVDNAAAALLHRTGLRVHAHPEVLGVQYNKLAMNVMGYAAAMSRTNIVTEGLLCSQWRRYVARPLLRECMAVYRKAGVRLEPIPGVTDIESFRFLLWHFGIPGISQIASFLLRFFFNRKPIVFSLQLDLERRKKTEIDFINGEVVRLGQEVGVATPRNSRVVELVHQLEERGDGTFLSRDEVIEAFQALAMAAK